MPMIGEIRRRWKGGLDRRELGNGGDAVAAQPASGDVGGEPRGAHSGQHDRARTDDPATSADRRAAPAAWPAWPRDRRGRLPDPRVEPDLAEQAWQRSVGDVSPVRQVTESSRRTRAVPARHGTPASVRRRCRASPSTQSTAAAGGRDREARRRRLPDRVVAASRRPHRRARSTAPSTRRRATATAACSCRSRSCNGLPSKSVTTIVIAGPQELAGVQVAMDPVTRDHAGVTQWLQHRTDPALVEPVESVEPTLRQLADRPSPVRRPTAVATIDGCRSASAE